MQKEQSIAFIVKAFLREHTKFKIKVCVIGAKKSGKTSLINSYLKYKNDVLNKLLIESDAHGSEMPYGQ